MAAAGQALFPSSCLGSREEAGTHVIPLSLLSDPKSSSTALLPLPPKTAVAGLCMGDVFSPDKVYTVIMPFHR